MDGINTSFGVETNETGLPKNTIGELYDCLEQILKREEEENEDIAIGLNSQKFLRLWEDFCKENGVQFTPGILNSRETLNVLRQKISNHTQGKKTGEKRINSIQKRVQQEVGSLTHFLIPDSTIKKEDEHIFKTEDFQNYVRTGRVNISYSPELVIQYINSDTIGEIHLSILIFILDSKDNDIIKKLIGCINSLNISTLDDSFYNFLRELMRNHLESIAHIISCISENNLSSIYWYTIDLITNPPSAFNVDKSILEGYKRQLRSLINEQNKKNIDKRVLNRLEYGTKLQRFLRSLIS